MNDVLFVLLRFPVISLFRYMFFTMRKISFDLNPAHEVIVLCCSNVKSTLRCVFQYALLYLFRLLHLLSLPASGKLVTPYSDSSTIQNRFIFNEFCVRTSPVDFSFPLAQCCISCYVSRGVLKLNIQFNHLYVLSIRLCYGRRLGQFIFVVGICSYIANFFFREMFALYFVCSFYIFFSVKSSVVISYGNLTKMCTLSIFRLTCLCSF